MDGKTIKKLLLTNSDTTPEILNQFKDDEMYNLSDLPEILIDRKLLETKLIEKYGDIVGKYIMTQTYSNSKTTNENVNPIDILKLIN